MARPPRRQPKTPPPPSGWIWLPNSVTAANLCCGFVSILLTLEAFREGRGPEAYAASAWLIMAAGVLDVLDGKLAKWTHSTSAFGMRMDSFADGVSFGLAPAVLAACALIKPGSLPWNLSWVFSGAYFFGAVLRLARYNVAVPGAHFGFTGLPSPAAALTVVSLSLASQEAPWPPLPVALILAGLGFLMLSRVPYAGFKGHTRLELKVEMVLALGWIALLFIFGVSRVVFMTVLAYDMLLGWSLALLRPLWSRTRSVSPRAR